MILFICYKAEGVLQGEYEIEAFPIGYVKIGR